MPVLDVGWYEEVAFHAAHLGSAWTRGQGVKRPLRRQVAAKSHRHNRMEGGEKMSLVHIPATPWCPTRPSANELVPWLLLARPMASQRAGSMATAASRMLLHWPTPRPSTGRLLLDRAVICRTRQARSALQRAARRGLAVVDAQDRDGAPHATSTGKRCAPGADTRRSRRRSQNACAF